jgi:4-hydroxybenzoate polyprenyltransferase
MRPVHWVKNLSVFAAIIMTGTLTVRPYLISVIWAFIAFTLATSATYIFNDVLDKEKDKLHPIKKQRPIAAGRIPIEVAILFSAALAITALYLAAHFQPLFFWAIFAYLVIQIFYSMGLKKLAIIDIIIIASGFVIRVYAGALVINAHLSVWFLLTVISVALFLASGKRRAELSILPQGKTRESLNSYKKELLNSYVTMFGNAAWIAWALYTFFESPTVDLGIWLRLADISRATTISKLLMATIPVVIFIIMRYEALIFSDKTEAPEKTLLTDAALIGGVTIWTAMVGYIIYGGIARI